MAEVATGVLHNVGNVLNSVNVSARLCWKSSVGRRLPSSERCGAAHGKAGSRPFPHAAIPKGSCCPASCDSGSVSAWRTRKCGARSTSSRTTSSTSRRSSPCSRTTRSLRRGRDLPAERLVEDALRMNTGALIGTGSRSCADCTAPAVRVDKHKVLQILVNLIRNAKHALDDAEQPEKQLTSSRRGERPCAHRGADNGIGIAPENLTRIFAHGFTTEKRPRLRPAQRRPRRQGDGRLAQRPQRRPRPRRHLHPRTADGSPSVQRHELGHGSRSAHNHAS